MSKVIVLLADGCEECEALITVDVLRRAGIEVETASVSGKEDILSSHKISIRADLPLDKADFEGADALVLPGGVKGVENLSASAEVKKLISDFLEKGKTVAAICAAPSILAGMGLLDGKTATVNPGFEKYCTAAVLTHGKAARDGNIITGQAVGGSFEFALLLTEKLEGKECADKVRASICL